MDVEDGVVTLTGQVEDDDVRDRLRDFVRRVQGVNLVINQMKTDAQVLTAREFAVRQLQSYWQMIHRNWLLAIIAVVLLVASAMLARLFNRFSETLLWPLSGNVLLRSVLGSLIASMIVVGGVMAALQVFGAEPGGAVVPGIGRRGGVGRRLRVSGHHGELHCLDPARPAQAVPGGRLHRDRRTGRRGQVAEHAGDLARDAGRQPNPDLEFDDLQGNPR